MKSQNRWISGQSTAQGVFTNHTHVLNFLDSPAVNAHGLRVDINCEPEAQEANANGFWIVYALLGQAITEADFPSNFNQLDDEDIQAYVWGVGAWMASNTTPFIHTFAPKTSRNFVRDARIVLQVRVEGVLPVLTNVRINSTITCFT